MIRGGVPAAIAAALAMSGCSLLLDFSAPVGDAGPAGDGGGADAADTCTKDEPNDSQAAATPVASGAFESSLCPATDRDFYAFDLDGATDLVAVLTFAAAADLTLTLYDAGGTALTVSAGSAPEERIEHSAALANVLPAGSYALEVVGAEGTTADATVYQLDLSIGAPPADPPDAGVPDAAI